MGTKSYIAMMTTVVGAALMSPMDGDMKALAVAIIMVVSLIANLLYIGGRFRELIIGRIMRDVKDEIVKLKLLNYEEHESAKELAKMKERK